MKKNKPTKTYLVVRRVVEKFEVQATSKKEAGDNAENPFEITIISEKITIRK